MSGRFVGIFFVGIRFAAATAGTLNLHEVLLINSFTRGWVGGITSTECYPKCYATRSRELTVFAIFLFSLFFFLFYYLSLFLLSFFESLLG